MFSVKKRIAGNCKYCLDNANMEGLARKRNNVVSLKKMNDVSENVTIYL